MLRNNFRLSRRRRQATGEYGAPTCAAPSDVTIDAISAVTAAKVAAEAAEHGKADYTLDAKVEDAAGLIVAATRGRYRLRAHG